MKRLFIGVVFSCIIIFMYWTSIYFVNGYNLTTNVKHLDLGYMVNSLFNNNDYSQSKLLSDILGAFGKFTQFFSNVPELPNYASNNGFKIVINAVNYILRFTFILWQPLSFIFNLISAILTWLDLAADFVLNFLRFLLFPRFI